MGDPVLPPFPHSAGAGLWNARSPRIPYVEPWPVDAREEPAPAPHPASFVLEFSSGQLVTIAGTGVIGRAPRDGGAHGALQLVSIDDPARSVSKVHARFEIDALGLWIEDLDSGNGTVIVQPGGSPVALRPGERNRVEVGAVVRLGRQSFTVR